MAVLIIAEFNDKVLSPASAIAINAAKKLGEVDVLIAGIETKELATQVKNQEGVKTVLLADAPYYEHGLAEELAPLIHSLAEPYSHIGAAATVFGKNLMPRVAALLDASQISDVVNIVDHHTFTHPIYAGNALETVQSDEETLVLTFRTTAFEAPTTSNNEADVIVVENTEEQNLSQFVEKEIIYSDRPELTSAQIIVSGGRGLGSQEKFEEVLIPLVDQLKAALGASRAAVDAGYAPNDYQVGQTGKIVAPELYFAIGLSGAIQHLAGMKDSKTVVAINKDPDAPIFKHADYGLVADLFTAVPELVSELKK